MQNKTILHAINSLSVGGAEVLLKNSINLLPGYRHVVVYLFAQHTLQPEIRGDVEFICLNHRGWSDTWNTVRKIRRIIRDKAPVLIHTHLFEATLFSRLAAPRRLPLLTTIHSMYSVDAFTKNRKSLWAERLTLRRWHRLIGVSGYVLQDYLNWVPFRGQRSVLYNFLPRNYFLQRRLSEKKEDLRCVAVGNLKEAKNYFYLLQVFQLLKGKSISLDIYGVGSQFTELQELIRKEDLNVRLCGKGNIPDSLIGYDLFIQASLHEGFGIAVIEAMAASLPVLISDIPVFREITGGAAHFFPLDNPEAVARTLLAFRDDPVLRNLHVEKAYAHVLQSFSPDVYRDKLEEIYRQAVNRGLA